MWHRVFGTSSASVPPEALLQHLKEDAAYASAQFQGDKQGWFRVEVSRSADPSTFVIERFLSSEEGMRDELNTWAAWLEVNARDAAPLMQHMIGTSQVFLVS